MTREIFIKLTPEQAADISQYGVQMRYALQFMAELVRTEGGIAKVTVQVQRKKKNKSVSLIIDDQGRVTSRRK